MAGQEIGWREQDTRGLEKGGVTALAHDFRINRLFLDKDNL